MVAYKISMTEGQQGTVPESTVLSRVRMLESNDNRSSDTPPLPNTTRKSVPFQRRGDDGAQHHSLQKESTDSSDRQESVTKRSSFSTMTQYTNDSKSAMNAPNGTNLPESRLPTSTNERGSGLSLRREAAYREQEPNGDHQPPKSVTTSEPRHRANPSPRGDPLGFRGTVPTNNNRRALSESPLRPTRRAESPSRGGPLTKDTTSSSATKKFDNWDKPSTSRRPLDKTELPASALGERKESSTPKATSRDSARQQLAATYFTSLRKGSPDNQNVDAEKQLVRPVPVLPSSLLPKKDNNLAAQENRRKAGISDDSKLVALRKAEAFSALVKDPIQTRASSPLLKREMGRDAKNAPARPRAPSPLPNLQRHHWDKKHEVSSKPEPSIASASKLTGAKKAPPLPAAQSNGVVELNWPNVTLKPSSYSKDGSSAASSSQGLQRIGTANQSLTSAQATKTGARSKGAGDALSKTALSKGGSKALKQNLNDASAVMIDEKGSHGGTSSSSGRSTLSQKELSGIASKALKLYQARIDTQASRNKNSMLHQMLTEKRAAPKPAPKATVPEKKSESTEAFAYSSAARLSERLTRAERFSALKESRIKSRGWQAEDGSMFSADSSMSPVKKTHPVFGYTNRDLTISMQDDASAVPSEPSCIRRSKHLSKVMQRKADHFASASPTRRMKNATGYRNSTPSKDFSPYPSQMPSKRLSPQKRASQQHRQTVPRPYYPPVDNALRSSNTGSNGFASKTTASLSDRRHIGGLTQREQDPPFFGQPYRGEQHVPDKAQQQYMTYERKIQQHRTAQGVEAAGYHMRHFEQENHHVDVPATIADDDFGAADFVYQAAGRPLGLGHAKKGKLGPLVTDHHNRTESYGRVAHRSPDRVAGHQVVYESRPELDSQFMSEVSEDGPATIGDDSNQDNTFTGSLNKHEVGHESSESYETRPDAFQWLHQKYGTQAPATNQPKATGLSNRAQAQVRSIENIEDDEEDDIFFGLEEPQSEDSDNKPKKVKQPLSNRSARSPGNHFQAESDPKEEKVEARHGLEEPNVTDGQAEAEARQGLNSQKTRSQKSPTKISHPPKASTKPNTKVAKVETPPISELTDEITGHAGKTVTAADSVTSDMTSSLVVDKGWKTRYRPNPVDTIVEEPQARVSVDDEDATADEDSLRDDGKPSASMFKSLSTAFVKSIQQACKMPGKMPDLAACAVDTKMKCEEKITEAWVGLSEEDADKNEDDTATATATVTVGQSEVGTVQEEMLNDVERRIWAAWDNRDQNHSEIASTMLTSVNDVPRQTSDSSISNTSRTHSQHQERRTDAQNKLLQHAEKAMELFGNDTEQYATMSTESSVSQGPKPKTEGGTPSSRLSTAISFEQRAVLERFSSSLKNEGVPVLKLSRRNKWQVRYLTVSSEVTLLSPHQDGSNSIGQCPKGLLWPKRITRGQSYTIASIVGNGRGGLLFANLKQVRQVASNEYYDRHLSKKLRLEFPVFAGVAVDYAFEGGQRQLHLCFKSKIDAQAFVTAMLIIREATERALKGDRKLESYPTESSGTKSFDH